MIQNIPNPKILQVDASGMPKRWVTVEDAIRYYATDRVLSEFGNPVKTFHGGYNRITQKQSKITANSIISTKGKVVRTMDIRRVPPLTNESLFERDRYICAYCGEKYEGKVLTRDHVKPVCQYGENKWTNVVTSCKPCNNFKGGRTLEQSRMRLLYDYEPYAPDRYEFLIVSEGVNRILPDQMHYLLSKVDKPQRAKYCPEQYEQYEYEYAEA